MSKKANDTRALKSALRLVQGLIGDARGAFDNDRDPDRGKHVRDPLDAALRICEAALSLFPADQGAK